MKRDVLVAYGDRPPLPSILEQAEFRSQCKRGVELRRAAARALNEALVGVGVTRRELAARSGIELQALARICNARRDLDVALLKRLLWQLGRDWRDTSVRFAEAIDYRRAGSASSRGAGARPPDMARPRRTRVLRFARPLCSTAS